MERANAKPCAETDIHKPTDMNRVESLLRKKMIAALKATLPRGD